MTFIPRHTYIYRINFQCDAENITEADKLFVENTKLRYWPNEKKPPMAGWMSPLVTVEIVRDPQLREQIEDAAPRTDGGSK